MQNNVTELTQRLLRSLDSNYNVIDMPTVVEIISLLEKVAITKELLETTRLGKHVNELRRKTTNEPLSKRAKELVKKWRSMVLPDSNGQIKQASGQEDVNLNQVKAKKRPPNEVPNNINAKRPKINGVSELDLSDNSNSSFKDVITSNVKTQPKRDVILINSDSNSSLPDTTRHDSQLDLQIPKKRGRKKGSKNHKNLIDEAETSFTIKLAVSRGNSKVKTTQELIASLQNRTPNSVLNLPTNAKTKEDLNERAAKLTERVSIIDQKLNTNANRFKNSQRKNKLVNEKNERVIESGSVINDKSLLNSQANSSSEDIIVVDEPPINTEISGENPEKQETEEVIKQEPDNVITSLSVAEALAQLPPIDKSVLQEDEERCRCTCLLVENKTDFSVEEDAEVDCEHRFEFVEDHDCQAKTFLTTKYHLDCVTEERVRQLHESYLPNVNGNYSLGCPKPEPQMLENGLYVNVVPNVNIERLPKDIKSDFSSENYKKYSISESDSDVRDCTERTGELECNSSDKTFREWHEVVSKPSYNGEILPILPYVIID